MNIAKIAYVFPALLFMLGGCKEKSVASVSEFSARIHALDPYVIDAKRCSLVDSAIAAYPEEASFYLERSICKFHLSNDTGEIADLTRAVDLSQGKDCATYYAALTLRAHRWRMQGKDQAAFDDFWASTFSDEQCQPEEADRDVSFWNAGSSAIQLLRFDLIDSVIQHWERVDSGSIRLNKLRAEAYRLKGMPQEALMAYNIVLQDSHERQDDLLWIGRAKVHQSLQDNKNALLDLAVAKSLVDGHILRTKDSLAFSYTLAEILFLKGSYVDAIKICDRFLGDDDPDRRSMLYCTRGQANLALGNAAQACADWEKSAALGWAEAKRYIALHCGK